MEIMGLKVWAYVVLAGLLIGAVKWYSDARYDAGWNAHSVEQTAMIRKAERAAVDKARIQWENTTEIAEKAIVIEEKIVEVIRIIEKEIPITVEKIVTVHPECRDLGDDFARLLNAQVAGIAAATSTGVETSTESHD